MRVAVVGHTEYVEFAEVDRVPLAGEIAHADLAWGIAAGGGAVAAAQFAKLAGHVDFLTVLGEDGLGETCVAEIEAQGVTVHAARRDTQRRALTLVEPAGERTITTIGPKLVPGAGDDLPWDLLDDADGVFFVAGDEAALDRARGARILTATSRELPTLAPVGVRIDALIGSARDPGERYERGQISPEPSLVVRTEGARGGSWVDGDGQSGRWDATRPPGPAVDAYGCGDSFAAGVSFGLARGLDRPEALALGARCGAACLTGRGPYAAQLQA